MMLTTTTYANTAYRSDKIPVQPAAPAGYPKGMGATIYKTASRLPWGNTQQTTLLNLIDTGGSDHLVKVEKEFKRSRGQLIDEFDGAMNHICIRPVSLSKWSAFLYYGTTLSKWFSIIVAIFSLFPFSLFYLKTDSTVIEILKGMAPVLSVFVIMPFLFWLVGGLCLKYFPLQKGKGAKWELNRQTGMLTIYKQQGDKDTKQRIAFTKPFYEFDAYLTRNPSHQGIIYYNLRLQHRYENLAIEGFLDNSTGSQAPVLAAWDCIQNYMDTTQPLPEIGDLEMFRQYDPTTIAYDKKTKRNPRFRRDMSLDKWLEYKQELQAQIEAVNYTNRPNIMENYVDYSQLPS